MNKRPITELMNDINQDLRHASYVQDQEKVRSDYNTVINTISVVQRLVIVSLLSTLVALFLYKNIGLPVPTLGFIIFLLDLTLVGYLMLFQCKLNKLKYNIDMRMFNTNYSLVLNNKFLVSIDDKYENIECLNIITNRILLISDLVNNNINIENLLSEVEDFKSSNSPYVKGKYVNIDLLADYIELVSLRQKIS